MEEKNIARAFFIITNKLKRHLDKLHNENDIHLGQARVLSYLYRNKDKSIYQKDLEQTFQIRRGSVTGLIDTLVKQSLLNRVESRYDKRKRKLVLTELGLKKGEEAINTITKFEHKIYDLLNDEELMLLDNVFEKINNFIDLEEERHV